MLNNPTWPLRGDEAQLPDQVAAIAAAIRGSRGTLDTLDVRPGHIAVLFALRTSRNLDALAHLSRSGYANEAAGIVRAILEDAVSLAYLAESPDDRAEQWVQFGRERAERSLAAGDEPPDNGSWWSGKGPSAMARCLTGEYAQLGNEFRLLYWRLCDDTHGSPLSATNYVTPPEPSDERPPLLAGPSNHRVKEMSALGAVAATRVCHVAVDLGVQIDLQLVESRAAAAMRPFEGSQSGPASE
jgi:hypothetical protein